VTQRCHPYNLTEEQLIFVDRDTRVDVFLSQSSLADHSDVDVAVRQLSGELLDGKRFVDKLRVEHVTVQ